MLNKNNANNHDALPLSYRVILCLVKYQLCSIMCNVDETNDNIFYIYLMMMMVAMVVTRTRRK